SVARRSASSFFQLLYAAAAAATASSTWARVPRGQVASVSPRAGLMTSSCSGVVTERPLISMAYEPIGSSTCGGAEGPSPPSPPSQAATHPRGRAPWVLEVDDSAQTVDRTAPDGPAGEREREAAHDRRGDVHPRGPLRGRLLPAAPLGEPEPSDGGAVAVGCLPVESPALEIAERGSEAGEQSRPLAIDRDIAGA